MKKNKLPLSELIEHMKSKNITFKIMPEDAAKDFLEKHNFYFKLSSYRKNFNKISIGSRCGQYINLDFSYLKDLSKIDSYLRYLVLEMCLDIEHYLKTIFLNDISKNTKEDGYNIVQEWDKEFFHRNKIYQHLKTSYCKELMNKYHPNYPVWALVELISFGELCKLINVYNKIYPKRLNFDIKLLFLVRDIRNACAHNNCLIHNLRENSHSAPNPTILKEIQKLSTISKRVRKSKLKNKPIHDFICLLYVYPLIVKNKELCLIRKKSIDKLIRYRMKYHSEYYKNNALISTVYLFILRVWKSFRKKY